MRSQKRPYPGSIEEAVAALVSYLPLKEKAAIARMDEDGLLELNLSLGLYVRDRLGLWSENKKLLDECLSRFPGPGKEVYKDAATAVIIKALWQKLRETHSLRIV
ncbi:MAG: hypothetical protein L3J03_04490 [Desulfobacterales bacterium]|nr:hypothetical protein [Desulfobacterales bacterium]